VQPDHGSVWSYRALQRPKKVPFPPRPFAWPRPEALSPLLPRSYRGGAVAETRGILWAGVRAAAISRNLAPVGGAHIGMCTLGGCPRLPVHSFGVGPMKLIGSSPSRAHARFWS
jgi:hypothetical protein